MREICCLIVLFVFGIGACQSNSANNAARVSGNAANKEAVVTNMTTLEKQVAAGQRAAAQSGVVQAKYYPGTGVITGIRKNTGEVELDHEEIKGKAPARKMMFPVKEKDFLVNLKIGDKVNFVLEDDAGYEQLSSIAKK